MADRYNTPAEGTLDWHVPLNENFDRLDRDVEIRDLDSNLGGYEPKADAKFFATDTGAVYIGDGDQWNQVGSVSGSPTSGDGSDIGGDMANGTVVAEPGEVQATLDSFEDDSGFGRTRYQKVQLVSGATYETSGTIRVPSGVYLDCNGATIEPQGDHNAIETGSNCWIENAHVTTYQVNGYSSAAIEISAKWADRVNGLNPVRVTNAYVHGNQGEGTGIRFRGGDNPCGLARVEGHVIAFDKGLHFAATGGDRSGRGDWSNGNQFYGFVGQCRSHVHLSSKGAAVSGNTVFAQMQTNDDVSEWIVYQEDDPRDLSGNDYIDGNYVKKGNNFFIYGWDLQGLSNQYQRSGDRRAPLWYIGEGQQPYNTYYDLTGKYSNEYVVNNSALAGRNGLFNAQGGLVTGTVNFTSGTHEFQPGSDRENWHPASNPSS